MPIFAVLLRGGEVGLSRLAHNQKVGGSNPSLATGESPARAALKPFGSTTSAGLTGRSCQCSCEHKTFKAPKSSQGIRSADAWMKDDWTLWLFIQYVSNPRHFGFKSHDLVNWKRGKDFKTVVEAIFMPIFDILRQIP